MKDLEKVVDKKFNRSDGPFVKNLDLTLASFHVQRQAYYGGTFVGNHVHSCLKVCSHQCTVSIKLTNYTFTQTNHIDILCNSVPAIYMYIII